MKIARNILKLQKIFSVLTDPFERSNYNLTLNKTPVRSSNYTRKAPAVHSSYYTRRASPPRPSSSRGSRPDLQILMFRHLELHHLELHHLELTI